MFRRRENASAGGAPPPQDPPAHEPESPEVAAAREQALLLQCWRRSEQRVLRTWHAWQAAAARDKPECYRAYLRALADEERAAASVELATRSRASRDSGNGMAQPAGS